MDGGMGGEKTILATAFLLCGWGSSGGEFTLSGTPSARERGEDLEEVQSRVAGTWAPPPAHAARLSPRLDCRSHAATTDPRHVVLRPCPSDGRLARVYVWHYPCDGHQP